MRYNKKVHLKFVLYDRQLSLKVRWQINTLYINIIPIYRVFWFKYLHINHSINCLPLFLPSFDFVLLKVLIQMTLICKKLYLIHFWIFVYKIIKSSTFFMCSSSRRRPALWYMRGYLLLSIQGRSSCNATTITHTRQFIDASTNSPGKSVCWPQFEANCD